MCDVSVTKLEQLKWRYREWQQFGNVAELARSYTIEAVETLVGLIRHCKDDRVRGTASQALLDRGWGKAKVQVGGH